MKKDSVLHNMYLAALILSAAEVFLGILAVIFPKVPVFIMSNGMTYDFDDYTMGAAMPLLIGIAVMPAMYCVIAAISMKKESFSQGGGALLVFGTLGAKVFMTIMNFVISLLSPMLGSSAKDFAITIMVRSSISFLGWLGFIAILLLVSAGAIELYVTKKMTNVSMNNNI